MSIHRRSAMTIIETAVALAILAAASMLTAQLAAWALFERVRTDERLAAMEFAANVMELARARTVSGLNEEWAREQRISDELSTQLREPSLAVRVELVGGRADSSSLPVGMKRVSVELRWKHRDGTQARTVELTGLFADRSAGGGS